MTPRRRCKTLHTLSAALVATALAASAAGAQDDDEIRRHGIFLETVDVSLVNLEVVVHTKDGKPVLGLTREDFEVTDDGESVEITHFYSVEAGHRQRGSVSELEPWGAPPEGGGILEGSSIVVVFDNSFLSLASRREALASLEESLATLVERGTRLMIVSKGREVEVEQFFTTDVVALSATLAELATNPPAANRHLRGSAHAIRQVDSGAPPGEQAVRGIDVAEHDARAAAHTIRSLAAEQYDEVRRSVMTLRGFVNSLAGLPGRKAVVYVSDRLPLRPGELEWTVWWEKYGETFGSPLGIGSVQEQVRRFDTQTVVSDLVADASASRVAFYPLGTGLDSASAHTSAERRGTSNVLAAGMGMSGDLGGDGLRWLAIATGGEAALRNARSDVLIETLHRDLGHYYSLGYPSPHRGDGGNHRIKVRVLRPDAQVRYLKTYRDKGSEEEMHDRNLAALLLGSAENPLGVEVHLGEVKKQDRGLFQVPLAITFPLSGLTLLPRDEVHVGDVSIFLRVRDVEGGMSEPLKIPLPVEIKNETILKALTQRGIYRTVLTLRGGEQAIAIGVRDEIGATGSTVRLDVRVGGNRG